MLFTVDFQDLIGQLLPMRWRKPLMQHWLLCLQAPTIALHQKLLTYRASVKQQLRYNSQVVYLQAALNDGADSVARRIFLSEGSNGVPLWLYTPAEEEPRFLGLRGAGAGTVVISAWLFTRSETVAARYDFIVWVPVTLIYDPIYLKGLIDSLRLPTKGNYIIMNY